ncbi:MAG: epoxyqueuosine reductase QueH [Clostridiales bacterium]|nr:epoxyqueuosine reductase QueH [Clostridiales bacterium]
MKILLHTCCAPCSVKCIETLRAEGTEPALLWYNPNIHPYTEYRQRLATLAQYSADINAELITHDEYGLRDFVEKTRGAENRCAVCYRMRLSHTALAAAQNGFAAFSTTLLVSPYQNHELLASIAEEVAAETGVAFLYRDFRPLFRQGQTEARRKELYMQKYCGCIFSEEERYLNKDKKKEG